MRRAFWLSALLVILTAGKASDAPGQMSISADEQIKRGQYLLLWTGHRTKLIDGKSIRRCFNR